MIAPPLIVPDVNVFVSGTTISAFAPSTVLRAWKQGGVEIATSKLILAEAHRVFTYPKIIQLTHMTPQEVDSYLADIEDGATVVAGESPIHVSPDPDDDKFFACAVEAQADYIVSMDKKHVLSIPEYQGVKTVHPSDFVRDILQPAA